MTKLIADIGGTNARFAIVNVNGGIDHIRVLSCADYPTLSDAARTYLKDLPGLKPANGAFAVATYLDGGDQVSMTNHAWSFSVRETAQNIGLQNLKVINDFTAIALGMPSLADKDYYQVGGGDIRKGMPIGIIGPGTGLGVSAIVFDAAGNAIPLTTEGGHVTMPAETQRIFDIFAQMKRMKYHHISAERVCSGKGLVNLYQAIETIDGNIARELTPAEITEAGLNKICGSCAEALDLFCHFLGVAAGNLALTYGAGGGIFIAGGIVPQLGDYFKSSRFRESYEAKGRFKDYVAAIPTFVVTHPYPGLEGLKNAASA